ncbi:MAG TPA: hypothetical protein PK231_03410 [Acidocella sp.]|nr:MAG: hypothetical protein B7Z77_04415 [Acidocella sp. 20-58-15]HQT38447.1 hypothetical protein [Acidocella sp.]
MKNFVQSTFVLNSKSKSGSHIFVSTNFVAILFMLPFIIGSIRNIITTHHWFADFEALSCAGEMSSHKLSPYIQPVVCDNAQPTIFVYPPAIANFLSTIQTHFGLSLEIAVYGFVFFAITSQILRLLILPDKYRILRAPFYGEIPGSALPSGNISIILHGLIFLQATYFGARPFLLVPLVVLATIIKPTFAVYFALFLFTDRPMKERFALIFFGVTCVLIYFLQLEYFDPGAFSAWQLAAHNSAFFADHGNSFLGLPFVETIKSLSLLLFLYGIFVMVLLIAGLSISELCLENQAQKYQIGIAVCLLLYPRLMSYDLLTLPFGLAVAAGSFVKFKRFQASHLTYIIQFTCGILILIGGRAGERLLFDFYCLLVLGLGTFAIYMKYEEKNFVNDKTTDVISQST